jgi:SAM-dependent methyltransferase
LVDFDKMLNYILLKIKAILERHPVKRRSTLNNCQDPIIVSRNHGSINDCIDTLNIGGFEDPDIWEKTMIRALKEAESDEELYKLFQLCFLQKNRDEAFSSFLSSRIVKAISVLLDNFGITTESSIVDLGCGPGHLAHALNRLGYGRVTAMDPNNNWYTGTGYLKSVSDDAIRIINDLDEWRKIIGEFDAIVTQGTIHHWQQIPRVSIDARRTMKPGAFWFAINEYYSISPKDFSNLIRHHPTASRYNSYEWAYPASAYADLIQSVGFSLVAVIPWLYNNCEFLNYTADVPPGVDIETLSRMVDANLVAPYGTVEMFWEEVDFFRRHDQGLRLFSVPQVMVFQRIDPY